MDLSSLKEFKKNIWYRGSKTLSVVKYKENYIKFSNDDVIEIIDNDVLLNKKILTNIPDLNIDELLYMYIDNLKKRGYKFI